MAKQQQEYSFVPAILKFSSYLNEYMQNEMNITEKISQLDRKKRLQEFTGSIKDRFSNLTNRNDVNKMTGDVLSEALSQGYFEAIPMIGQFSGIYDKGLELGLQEKTGKALLGTLSNDLEIFDSNGNIMKMGDMKEQVMKGLGEGGEYQAYQILQKLVPAKEQSFVGYDNATDKITFSKGMQDPTGKWIQDRTKTGEVLTEKGTPYIESNNQKGMQPEETLDPKMMQEYLTATYQQRQRQSGERQLALQEWGYKLKNDELTLANLSQLRTITWQEEKEYYNKAFGEELKKAKMEGRGSSDADYLPNGAIYKELETKYFKGDQINPDMADFIDNKYKDDPGYQSMKDTKEQTEKFLIAFNYNIGTKEYQRKEKEYLSAITTREALDQWENATLQEQVKAVINSNKGKK